MLITRQSLAAGAIELHPPLLLGPQRIVLGARNGERVDFVPVLDGPIQRHVGHHASRGIDPRTRAALDRACGARERMRATYVRDVTYDELEGEIVRAEDRRAPLMWTGGLLLLFGALAAVIAYRRLEARAQIEHADALIDQRFRALENEPSRPNR